MATLYKSILMTVYCSILITEKFMTVCRCFSPLREELSRWWWYTVGTEHGTQGCDTTDDVAALLLNGAAAVSIEVLVRVINERHRNWWRNNCKKYRKYKIDFYNTYFQRVSNGDTSLKFLEKYV